MDGFSRSRSRGSTPAVSAAIQHELRGNRAQGLVRLVDRDMGDGVFELNVTDAVPVANLHPARLHGVGQSFVELRPRGTWNV